MPKQETEKLDYWTGLPPGEAPSPSATIEPDQKLAPLMSIGGLLLIIGIGLAAFFLFGYNTTVPGPDPGERVYNVGLLSNQHNGLLVGIAVAFVGIVCMITGRKTL